MRNLLFIVAMLASASGFAQAKSLQLTFGDVPPCKTQNGKIQNSQTTRAVLLHNPKVVSNMPEVVVKEYIFSVMPKGGEYYGPFTIKGTELPPEIRARLLTYPEARVFIEGIKVAEADGTVRTCAPILISYSN